MDNISEKREKLENRLKALNNAAVAFSAGVDSTLLLKISHDILGDNMIAVTVNGAFMPKREFENAIDFCKDNGIRHEIIDADPFSIKEFRENTPDRCYHCKKNIFTKIISAAKEYGITNIIDGTNADDLSDYRPGMKALDELGIISPLKDVNLTKAEIKDLSHKYGLPTADKPSFACLATRIPCGEEITLKKLKMSESAEQRLFELGFKQFRVRIHGNDARIEILTDDFPLIIRPDITAEINSCFKNLGFRFVTLDLGGYSMGSTNQK